MIRKKNKILITGGAGFIGRNLLSALSKNEWDIFVLDSLISQIHPNRRWNAPPNMQFIQGDICNKNTVRKCLRDTNYIVHLAAETGVGQSAYEIARYVRSNELGTAILLEEASKIRHNLKGVVLASSRAVYGEGKYKCMNCGIFSPSSRSLSDIQSGKWDIYCPRCNKPAHFLPSTEDQFVNPASIYSITKYNQEQLLRQFSESFNIPAITLRFQNVYGPGQSLGNPYTGIITIFSARILSGNPIHIYEDGNEKRDFIFIKDAVESIILSLKKGFTKKYDIYNVGSGLGTRVIDMANLLVKMFGKQVPVIITGKYRIGDIRHSWANINKIRKDLGFNPQFSLEEGLRRFVSWVRKQALPVDRFEFAERELKKKNLLFKINDS